VASEGYYICTPMGRSQDGKKASDQEFRAAIRLVRAEIAANAATMKHFGRAHAFLI
jgi:hypothetical protein